MGKPEQNLRQPPRIAVFGSFYPEFARAGSSTTGLVTLLTRSEKVKSVLVFGPTHSRLPPALDSSKLRVVRNWDFDRPVSLVRALIDMLGARNSVDIFCFNIYPTSFGRSNVANGVGLAIPPILALLTRKPVITYLHNIVETQDIKTLGYTPSTLSLVAARLLEWAILRYTTAVVPLESQSERILELFNLNVPNVLIPYVEAVYSLVANYNTIRFKSDQGWRSNSKRKKVLLFGFWGPQKDLFRTFQALSLVAARGQDFSVTIVGKTNPNFPGYESIWEKTGEAPRKDLFQRVDYVREDEVLPLFMNHDMVILPYSSSGGYSGVMNIAAASRVRVVAYDLPQLRETAETVGADVHWVHPGETEELATAIENVLETSGDSLGSQALKASQMLAKAENAAASIISLVEVQGPTPAQVGQSEE
jgi:glycosyltransferase involved in cell wall biosynthesis